MIKKRLKRLTKKLDWQFMILSRKLFVLSSFYYILFNKGFQREHRAVINGKVQFEHSKRNVALTTSILRRNTHRLEKGLLMRPRRSTFALDYIRETYQFYEKQINASQAVRTSSSEELKWAHDVLEAYFNVTESHPQIDPYREKFVQLPKPNGIATSGYWRPYQRDLAKPPSVAYEDLLSLAWRRRSVRWFLPIPVPRDLIEKALAVASLSPSACNRQPFVFRVFDDPELVPKVAALPGGTKGFAHQFPVIIALIGELRNYYSERDRHLIYIDASLAAMSFVLAAETLGLGTCCINWPDIEEDERRADALLKLEPDQRPVMFIAVGFPDPEGMVAYSQKKPIHQICQYNFE